MSKFYNSSRRTTPWSEEDKATALQSFIDQINQDNYYTKHPPLNSYYEIELLNSIKINKCKYCECNELQKFGFTKNGIRRYRCKKCGKTFSITNNTIFDNHKIPISEWLDFCLALFRGQSFTSISKNNRNSYNTTKYWINKIFLLLKNYQNDIILKHKVLIDETYYRVIQRDIVKVDNKMKRGLSENQICIGIGCDENRVYCHIEGYGKPSMNKTLDTFINHIEKESELIHDDEKSHNKLVEKLSLKSTSFNTKILKGLPDEENPLNEINRRCNELKRFLDSHSGFNRDDLPDYLNLFAFIYSPPINPYEKLEKLLNIALNTQVLLRYRRQKPIKALNR